MAETPSRDLGRHGDGVGPTDVATAVVYTSVPTRPTPTGGSPAPGSAPSALRTRVAALVTAWRETGERARTRKDAITAFAVRVASAAILYLSQVALARWIGGHDYGIYVAVWTGVLALSALSQLGFNTALIRLVPSYQQRGEFELLRGIVLSARVMALGAATALATLGALAILVAGPALERAYVWPALLVLVCLPMCALSDVHDGIGRAKGWIAIALAPPYVLRPLLVLVTMLSARLLGFPQTATTAVCAAIIATWTATAVQFVLIERRLATSVPAGPRAYDHRGWLATSLPLLAIGFADVVLQSADILVISRSLAPEQVAMYFAAAKTMSLVMFVHYAVGSAVANRFAALGARGDTKALQALVDDAVGWTFWPSLAVTGALLIVGWPLLQLFGPQFTAAYPTMFVLAIGFLIRSSFGPAEFLLNMLGEQRRCAVVLGGAAVACVALNLWAVPRYGIMGAAIATASSLAAASILNSIVAWRRLGLATFILATAPLGRTGTAALVTWATRARASRTT